jgi:hypothetical protein
MSIFFEACELCKNENIDELASLMDNHSIDIHEKDDLLLFIASENFDLNMIEFLINKGANLKSRQGAWFHNVFVLLSWEKFEYYFFNYIKDIEQNDESSRYNLFTVPDSIQYYLTQTKIDFFPYLKFFIDNDYPMPFDYAFNLHANLNYSLIEYLNHVGKLEHVIKNAYHLGQNNFKTRYSNEDVFFEYINNSYQQFPYYINEQNKAYLENKQFDKFDVDFWNLKCLFAMPIEAFTHFYNTYPDFIEYIIYNNGYALLQCFKLEQLKLILHHQDLTHFNEKNKANRYSAKYFDVEKLIYIINHVKLDKSLLITLFETGSLEIQTSIINQYDAIIEREQLEYLGYISYRANLPSLNLIEKKLNFSCDEKAFLDAIINNDLTLVNEFIEKQFNVNFLANSGLYLAIFNQHIELSCLLALKSEKNAHTFSIILDLANEEIIQIYLKESFSLKESLAKIFVLKNETIVHMIFESKKDVIIEDIFEHIKPIEYIEGLNLNTCLFLIPYFQTISQTNIAFTRAIFEKLIENSFEKNNSELISLAHIYYNIKPKYHLSSHNLNPFIVSNNIFLLNYCFEQGWILLNDATSLNSMSLGFSREDTILSEDMAQYLLSKIPKNHSYYQYVLIDTFKSGYLNLFFSSINPTEYDFVNFFISQFDHFHFTHLNDETHLYLFSAILDKIMIYQKEKLFLIEEKAYEINSPSWKKIQNQIQAYYEKNQLLSSLSLVSENTSNIEKKEGKKKGKI